jgi:starvation-inducible outer membrane lipoprotein
MKTVAKKGLGLLVVLMTLLLAACSQTPLASDGLEAQTGEPPVEQQYP